MGRKRDIRKARRAKQEMRDRIRIVEMDFAEVEARVLAYEHEKIESDEKIREPHWL